MKLGPGIAECYCTCKQNKYCKSTSNQSLNYLYPLLQEDDCGPSVHDAAIPSGFLTTRRPIQVLTTSFFFSYPWLLCVCF